MKKRTSKVGINFKWDSLLRFVKESILQQIPVRTNNCGCLCGLPGTRNHCKVSEVEVCLVSLREQEDQGPAVGLKGSMMGEDSVSDGRVELHGTLDFTLGHRSSRI